jgi:hypothetical protein
VDDPSDVVVIADESRRAQEVVDVDPADPLLAGADATPSPSLVRWTRRSKAGVP